MSIGRALQLNTAALAVMGAVFLGLGHRSSVLPLFLAASAVAAVIVGDFVPWLRLNRMVANLVALAAVAWSLKDFFSVAADDQLLAIANMLIYLQIVLLFQERSARVYWQLVVLSLLQVVVAAALSLGFYFAVLLAMYIVLSLSALVLLCAYRDMRHQAPGSSTASAAEPSPAWRALLAAPEVVPAGLSAGEVSAAIKRGMVLRLVAGLACATLVFTAVFFYATPRLSEGSWSHSRRRGGAGSGLAEMMRIEESGHIQLSNRLVMRASLTNMADGQPAPLIGDPYFHGFVLSRYVNDEQGSRWMPGEPVAERGFRRPPSPQLTQTKLVRLDVVLEEPDPAALFAIMPILRLDTNRVRYDYVAHRLRRRGNDDGGPSLGGEFRFAAATLGVKEGRQLAGLPNPNRLSSLEDAEYLEAELEALRQFDAERYPKLVQLAKQILREAEVQDGTDLDKALALERHFHVLDLYRYSLDLDFARDETLDPIEDFVVNHRSGHCEYFASALALMLRSQGIPARVAVGYKGGDFNPLGQYYSVQQRHAHAWVEAWMPPDAVPAYDIAGPASPGGTWYRLDSTPAVRDGSGNAESESIVRRIEQAFDYFDLMWRDYVLSLTADRQQGAVYDPVLSRAAAISWIESRSTRRWLRQWSERLGLAAVLPKQRVSQAQAVSNALAVLIIVAIVAAFVLVKLTLATGRFARRWWGARRTVQPAHRLPPAFYVRLEKLLARLPLKRAPGQTPRELAAAAQQRLGGSAVRSDVAHAPGDIVEAYYRVRFGDAHLDKNESEAIEKALASLVPAVSLAHKR